MVFSTAATLADLVERFGPIPVRRIRTTSQPGSATEQDVIELSNHEDRLYELYGGILLEKVTGFYESYLAMLLVRYLNEFVQRHDLGIVTGEAGMIRLSPGEIRIPDVAFVSWERLPQRQVPREPVPELAPDLAVEVISRGNTGEEMDRKLQDYFAAHVRLVWYVDPDRRTVRVFKSVDDTTELRPDQTLDGGDVLPGFALPLAQLFTEPDPSGTHDAT